MSRPGFVTGARVALTILGQTVPAAVILASENQRSLMLDIGDHAVRVHGGGLLIQMVPVLQADDGRWFEIVRQTPVTITLEAPNNGIVMAGGGGRDV